MSSDLVQVHVNSPMEWRYEKVTEELKANQRLRNLRNV